MNEQMNLGKNIICEESKEIYEAIESEKTG